MVGSILQGQGSLGAVSERVEQASQSSLFGVCMKNFGADYMTKKRHTTLEENALARLQLEVGSL